MRRRSLDDSQLEGSGSANATLRATSGSALRGLEQLQVALVALRLQALDRNEAQRGRVDAVAQARRCGTVVEQVAQVRIGVRPPELGPHHEDGAVGFLSDVRRVERTREARPPGAGLELVERAEIGRAHV